MSGRLRWLGHATVVVELDGARIVTDPVLRRRVLHLLREKAVVPPTEVDAVVISHLHYDHLDLPTLRRIGTTTPVFAPRGAARTLRRFENVTEVEPGDEVTVAGIPVRVVEAQHEGRRRNRGRYIAAVGYVLDGSTSIYFMGDTGLFDAMAEVGPVDVALIPVWGWGPKLDDDHLDPERAATALTLLRPRIAVPIHWGTYRVIRSPTSAVRRPRHSPRLRARLRPTSTCASSRSAGRWSSERGATSPGLREISETKTLLSRDFTPSQGVRRHSPSQRCVREVSKKSRRSLRDRC